MDHKLSFSFLSLMCFCAVCVSPAFDRIWTLFDFFQINNLYKCLLSIFLLLSFCICYFYFDLVCTHQNTQYLSQVCPSWMMLLLLRAFIFFPSKFCCCCIIYLFIGNLFHLVFFLYLNQGSKLGCRMLHRSRRPLRDMLWFAELL